MYTLLETRELHVKNTFKCWNHHNMTTSLSECQHVLQDTSLWETILWGSRNCLVSLSFIQSIKRQLLSSSENLHAHIFSLSRTKSIAYLWKHPFSTPKFWREKYFHVKIPLQTTPIPVIVACNCCWQCEYELMYFK